MLPVEGACPTCQHPTTESLQTTLMAAGNRYLRQISRGLLLAGWLTTGLGIGCIANPLTMLITGWYGPLAIVFLASICVYAWLQLAAGIRTAKPAPGESAGLRYAVIGITGTAFALSATAGLWITITAVSGGEGPGLNGALLANRYGLPGLVVLLAALGLRYRELCCRTGKRSLLGLCTLATVLSVVGAGISSSAYLCLPMGSNGVPQFGGLATAAIALVLGVVLLVAGMGLTAVLQFLLYRHLQSLAETLGDRTVLTGLPLD